VRAEYERALTQAKAQLGAMPPPTPTRKRSLPLLPADKDWREAPGVKARLARLALTASLRAGCVTAARQAGPAEANATRTQPQNDPESCREAHYWAVFRTVNIPVWRLVTYAFRPFGRTATLVGESVGMLAVLVLVSVSTTVTVLDCTSAVYR